MGLSFTDDYDYDELPLSDRHCPRCSSLLYVTNPDISEPDEYSCSDCQYESQPQRYESRGLFTTLYHRVLSALYPYEIAAAYLLFAIAGAAVGYDTKYAAPALATFLIGVYIGGYTPPTYCQHCGEDHHPYDGYCYNCGSSLDDANCDTDPRKKPVYAGVLERLNPWDNVEFGFHITLKSQSGDEFFERIAAPRTLWKRLFDLGVVITATAWAAIVGYVTYLTVTYWLNRPGLVESLLNGSSSGDGGTGGTVGPVIPWLLDTITLNLILTFLALFVGLAAAIIIHEVGHAIAMYVHGSSSKEIGIGFLFGIIPNFGYMEPENRELDPIPEMRVYSAGILMNSLGLLALAVVILAYEVAIGAFANPLSVDYAVNALGRFASEKYYSGYAVLGFVLGNAGGILNASPFPPGLDGDGVQRNAVRAVCEHYGIDRTTSNQYANYAGTIVAAFFIGIGIIWVV